MFFCSTDCTIFSILTTKMHKKLNNLTRFVIKYTTNYTIFFCHAYENMNSRKESSLVCLKSLKVYKFNAKEHITN